MTNAPADLLSFRPRVMARTGLTNPADVGIVGDGAHAHTGGYHEGKDILVAIGRYHPGISNVSGEDYSARLARDRSGLTLSASAMDVADDWPRGGRAAWLRFNNLLVADLHGGRPELAAVRAINYSPDGVQRHRIDRQYGFTVIQDTTDSVTIHTHIEWYRDTEGRRQAGLDRLLVLIDAAIANQPAPNGDDELSAESDSIIRYNLLPWLAETDHTASRIEQLLIAMAPKLDIGPEELAAIRSAANAGAHDAVAAAGDDLAARIVAALPADVAAGVAAAVTTAVKQVFAVAGAS